MKPALSPLLAPASARTFVLALVPVLTAASPQQPHDWPFYRGPEHSGASTEALPPLVAEAPLWSVDIGRGYSSPSVRGDTVFTLGFDGERSMDVVRALDAADGTERWSFAYPAELLDRDHGGGTLCTPTVDGERLYVSGRAGGLRCFEASSGRLLWYKDLLALYEIPPNHYGYSCSPVVLEGRVVVAMERALALDAETGDTLWVSEPLDADFSTPTPFLQDGVNRLALLGQQGLHVLDPEDGTQLCFFQWHKSDRLVNAASPVVVGEQLFISSAYDHGGALVDVSDEEGTALWASRRMRTKMAGAVFVNGHLFGFDESMFTCLDAATGDLRWRVRGLGNGSVFAAGDKLLVMTSEGELIVAAATGEAFEEYSRSRVFEDEGVYWSAPVPANGRVYCRSSVGTLVALELTSGAEGGPGQVATSELPSAADLLAGHLEAVGGAERLSTVSDVHITGQFQMSSVGFASVPLEVWRRAPALWRCKFALPPPRPGSIERMYDGEHAYEINAYLGHELFPEPVRRSHAEFLLLRPDLAILFDSMTTRGRVDFRGIDAWAVEVESKAGARRTLYFDVTSGFLAGHEGEGEALVVYSNYREFEGLFLPTVERRFVPDTGIEEIFRAEQVKFSELDEGIFTRPEEIQALIDDGKTPPGKQ